MRLSPLILSVCASFTFSSIAHALAIPYHFPDDFLYHKQPISPICFQQTGIVNLATCSAMIAGSKITGSNSELQSNGFVGFDYTYPDEHDKTTLRQAYSYYTVFSNPINNNYTVFSQYSLGGDGEFTALYLATRSGNSLNLQLLATGDRCNHGIHDVKAQDKILSYSVNLTPYDFLKMTNRNFYNLSPLDDLGACPTCCEASAVHQLDLQNPTNDQIVIVNIDPNANVTQGRLQPCFNTIMANYKQNSKLHLSVQQISDFAFVFNATCVK